MTQAPALHVDPANSEQARAWDGGEGAYWAQNAERFDRALAAYRERFLAAPGIGAGDRVLDIGCGTGQTTRDAARAAVDGFALGVDLSGQMIELARRLAAARGIGNACFQQADAQIHPFPSASFDVAISRTGTMFFGDQAAAFANIARAIRPGGQLAMLVWQAPEANEWIRELTGALAAGRDLPAPPAGSPGPFTQADPEEVRAVLAAAGFTRIELDGMQQPMWFGSDAEDAHAFVLGLMGWMLHGLDAGGRSRALRNLRATLNAHNTGHGVVYQSATWLITATRLALDVGQAFGELAVSDPDNIHTTYVPVRPVVAPAHDGAS
jgi:SAM-dependent methyltransferase